MWESQCGGVQVDYSGNQGVFTQIDQCQNNVRACPLCSLHVFIKFPCSELLGRGWQLVHARDICIVICSWCWHTEAPWFTLRAFCHYLCCSSDFYCQTLGEWYRAARTSWSTPA